MGLHMVLVGNSNSGKRTIFGALAGQSGHVDYLEEGGESILEGVLTSSREVRLTVLPGISALSAYDPLEHQVRKYLLRQAPQTIINIVDAVNLEQSLYLTLELISLGLPMLVALNRTDLLEAKKREVDVPLLKKELGIGVVNTAANERRGMHELALGAISIGRAGQGPKGRMFLSPEVERDVQQIYKLACQEEKFGRWMALQLFQRDEEVWKYMNLSDELAGQVEEIIVRREEERRTDSIGIVAYDRYASIERLYEACVVDILPRKRGFGRWWI
ncbi:MAG: FeoB small GTPase domain-containing protein [Eubacteriales bacterium]|jgi:ferrous iron transport protein B